MKYVRITYDCGKCGASCTTTTHNLKYRDHHKNEHICQKCLIKLEKSNAVFEAVPVEFHHQIFSGCLDYKIAIKYLRGISSKILVKFGCSICNCECCIRWSKIADRKHHQYDNICLKCLDNLIQNEPAKLELNRNNSKLLWQNKDYRIQCLRAFDLHNKTMQTDPEYANKHRRRSRSVEGTVLINGHKIRFDSAYELIFLWGVRDRYNKIRRCNFAIAYGNHFYHPDFFVVDRSGERMIVEVKGFYKSNVAEKQTAADSYIAETDIADSYILYDTERLLTECILRGLGGGHMWKQIGEINNATTIAFTDPKHQRIANIGINRFRREAKNKKHIEASLHG